MLKQALGVDRRHRTQKQRASATSPSTLRPRYYLPRKNSEAPKGAIAYLKRLYYDTAMSATPHALSSLRELVDPSHILFGSDHPFLPEREIAEMVDGLQSYRPFDAEARAAIDRGSALALFPRLKSAAGGTA